MKLWEVIKELTEHPHQVFESDLLESKGWKARMKVERGASRYFCFEVFDGERLIDQSLNGGAFNGNVSMDLDWQPVPQPVTWQEAFQAWIDGCYIRCEGGGRVSEFKNGSLLLDNLECPPSKWMMKNGKWYVED